MSPHFEEAELVHFCEAALRAMDTPKAAAALVAQSLVQADVRGVATHGIVRLPSYRAQVAAGEVHPQAVPEVLTDRGGATVFVDGRHAFGAVTAGFCTDLALERALDLGAGVVCARNCAHFGAAAHYALQAAEGGCVGVVASNTPAVMAPHGAREATVGNNPLAIAAPSFGARPPFVLDIAQSVVARGRIKLAEMAGQQIPEGWAVDREGRATIDPTAGLAGALLPVGGHKGSGLALAIELVTSVLSGSSIGADLENTSMTGAAGRRGGGRVGSVSQFFLALDPDAFAGREAFAAGFARLADAITGADPAPGFDEVMLPGERERRVAQRSVASGVELAPSTIQLLAELATELSLSPPAPLPA
jgi:LDH2 family malate/lactate/ureidoglycolate dehydrogenase